MNTAWTIGNFPKVGIRPIIDGRRRGIRESLEKQRVTESDTPTFSARNLSAHAAASATPPIVVSAMTHSTGVPSG